MIQVFIASNQLLFQVKVKQVFDKLLNGKYVLLKKIEDKNIFENLIYVVDVETENSMDFIRNIRKNDKNSPMICISCRKNKMYFLASSISNFIWIDKEKNYEEQLKKTLLSILVGEREETLIFYGENWKVVLPYNDILLIRRKHDAFYFQACSDHCYYNCLFSFYENMEYIWNGERKCFSFYSMKDFTIFYGVDKKIYSSKLKDKVIALYLQGVSVKTLQKEYGVSQSSIYSWVKQYRMNCELQKREELLQKYFEIEQIIKR